MAADLPADVAGLPLRLHPDGFDRPAPTAPPALLAAAGLLAFVGVGALLSEVFDDERALAIVLGGLGLAGAVVLAILGGPRFVTAASAIAGVAVIVFVGGLLGDWLGEEPGPYLLLLALAELVLFLAVPGLRGRPFLLALALALLALGLAALVADDRFQGVSDDVAEGTAFEVDDPLGLSPSVSRGATTLLVVGGAYLGAAFLLDRRQHWRLATPFVAIGAAAAVLGAYGTTVDLDDTQNAALVIVVGAALVAVGAYGARRASLWLGAGLAAVGAVSFGAAVAGDSAAFGGLIILVLAAVIGVIGYALANRALRA